MDRFSRSFGVCGLLVVALTLSSAQCFDDGSRVTVDVETEPLHFDRVAQGQRSSFADTLEVVVEDSTRWNALTPLFRAPARQENIDFEEMMVVLAAVPAQSGGFDVQFRSIEVERGRIIAHYAVGVPGDDCITTMGLTVPYDAVVVRRVELPVVFERSQETIPCTFR